MLNGISCLVWCCNMALTHTGVCIDALSTGLAYWVMQLITYKVAASATLHSLILLMNCVTRSIDSKVDDSDLFCCFDFGLRVEMAFNDN